MADTSMINNAASSSGGSNWGGYVASAAGQVGSGMFGAMTAGRQNRLQRKHEMMMYNLNTRVNKRMWDMENLYNSPAMQMKRLKEAGLNPNLVYGNGATMQGANFDAASPTINSPKPIPNPFPGNMVSEIYDLRHRDAQIDLLREQTQSQDQNQKLTAVSTLLTKLRSDWQRATNHVQKRTIQTQIDTANATLEDILEGIKLKSSQGRAAIASAEYHQGATQKMADELLMEWQRHKINLPTMRAKLDQIRAETDNTRAHTGLTQSNTRLSDQNLKNARLDEKLKELDYTMTRLGFNKNDGAFSQMLKNMMSVSTNTERRFKIVEDMMDYVKKHSK